MTPGARLHMPRDLHIAYTIGRMGVATAAHIGPLFYSSPNTARVGCARLLKLGLLRTFERPDVSRPAWYALASEASGWVAEQIDCEEQDLRSVTGIRRMNLEAVAMRNRFWVSVALACRPTGGKVVLELFRPEWELRRLKTSDVPVVPDAQVVLQAHGADPQPLERVFFVEFDAGTERTTIWARKAEAFAAMRDRSSLYGAAQWFVLAVVPSVRRARSVAAAVAGTAGGAFTFLAVAETLMDGRAFDRVLYRAPELAAARDAEPSEPIVGR
jgi:hypothetical protein